MDKEVRDKLWNRIRRLDIKKKEILRNNKGRHGWFEFADEAIKDVDRKKNILLGQIYCTRYEKGEE